jgi:hypothetical protein
LSLLLKPMTVRVVAVTIAVAIMKADATVASISDAPRTRDANIIGKMVAASPATRVTAVNRFLRSAYQRPAPNRRMSSSADLGRSGLKDTPGHTRTHALGVGP